MTQPNFANRCALAEQALPDAPYRNALNRLHREMLAQIQADDALLWLCREMLRELPIAHPQQGPRREELIEALNKRLSNA